MNECEMYWSGIYGYTSRPRRPTGKLVNAMIGGSVKQITVFVDDASVAADKIRGVDGVLKVCGGEYKNSLFVYIDPRYDSGIVSANIMYVLG